MYLSNMFWKNKVISEGREVTLSLREVTNVWLSRPVRTFLAYKHGSQWRGLVGYEEYKEEVDALENKLDLILDHLKLEYVPPSEKCMEEPAKLVEKQTVSIVSQWDTGMTYNSGLATISVASGGGSSSVKLPTNGFEAAPPKKKRGRPKKIK